MRIFHNADAFLKDQRYIVRVLQRFLRTERNRKANFKNCKVLKLALLSKHYDANKEYSMSVLGDIYHTINVAGGMLVHFAIY